MLSCDAAEVEDSAGGRAFELRLRMKLLAEGCTEISTVHTLYPLLAFCGKTTWHRTGAEHTL